MKGQIPAALGEDVTTAARCDLQDRLIIKSSARVFDGRIGRVRLPAGAPILGLLTGLDGGSLNPKTGPMAQAYILRADVSPMDAKRRNLDDAICGECTLRGRDGVNSGCYVWNAPRIVFERATAGAYLELGWSDLQAVVKGQTIQLGAYGDPAAIPFEVWQALLRTAGWVAYTHQWTTCPHSHSAGLDSDSRCPWCRSGCTNERTLD